MRKPIADVVRGAHCVPVVAAILICLLLSATRGRAQTPYPVPRLATIAPAGVKAGSAVEVTLTGADLDDVKTLLFSDPSIKAERVPDPPPPKDKKQKPPPKTLKFKVTTAAQTPVGIHDVRAVGKWGISNPRAFVVGQANEIAEKEPNNDVPQAQTVALGDVVNGAVNPKPDVDYFRFAGKKGQRVVIHAAAWSIDSKLNPYIQLFDENDHELAANRNYRNRDAVLDCVLPGDGNYLVRLCEFTYLNAGPEYFYRLSVSTRPWIDVAYPPVVEAGKPNTITLLGRNLPGGQAASLRLVDGSSLEKSAVAIAAPAALADDQLAMLGTSWPRSGVLDGFEYRLASPAGPSNAILLARVRHAVVLDNDKNNTPAEAQPITVPTEVCGRIERTGDRDWYVFSAKKGDVVILEGFADRLRSPVDLLFQVQRKGGEKPIGIFDDHPDHPAKVGRLYLGTNDPKARLVVPEDGDYELMVRSHGADLRAGARHVYRVSVRAEQPDFRLLLLGNNDASTGGCTVRRGGSQDLEVVCYRQDGFDGEVTLSVEGLPQGITCPPQVLGPKQQRTALVISAARNAPLWAGPIKVVGTSTIKGAAVKHEPRAACLVWPAPNNVPPLCRLARSTCLAVREEGPFALDTSVKELSAPAGGSATIKLKLQRFAADFKVQVQIDAITGPAQADGKPLAIPKLNIAAGKNEGDVKFNLPSNSLPGTYNLAFRGTAKYPFAISGDPKKKKTNVDVAQVTPPVRLVVYNKVADLTLSQPQVILKAGAETPLIVRFQRLHGYKGDFKLQAVLPQGMSGLAIPEVTVPANAAEGRLMLKADAKAKPSAGAKLRIRAIAKIGGATLTSEVPLTVSVLDAKSAALPPGVELTAVKLLAAGAPGWKYLPAAQVKGADWLKLDFQDKTWRTAKAPLGYGESDVMTRKGTVIADQGQNLYCRHAFDVPAALLKQPGIVFRLAVASDNSAVVYVNGVKVDDDAADHEFSYWNREVTLKAEALRPGVNVIAVQVNNSAGSSDAYCDVEFTALAPKKK